MGAEPVASQGDDPASLQGLLTALAHLLLTRTQTAGALITLTDGAGATAQGVAGDPDVLPSLAAVAEVVGARHEALVVDEVSSDPRLRPDPSSRPLLGAAAGVPLAAGASTGVGAVCVGGPDNGPLAAAQLLDELARVRDGVTALVSGPQGSGASARQSTLLAASPAIVTVVDADLVHRYANPRSARHFGVPSPGDLVGRSLLGFVPEDDADEVAEIYDAVLAGEAYYGQLRHLAGPGTASRQVRLVETSCVAIIWEGRPAVLSTALDVTHRALVDSGLAAVARAAQVFSAASVGYLEVSLDGQVRDHNPYVATLLGTAVLTGRRLGDVVVPADRARVREAGAALAAGQRESAEMSVRMRSADGAPVPCVLSLALVRDVVGQPSHVAAIVLDDSARHAAQAQLAERHERSVALLAAIPDAVLICTPHGIITEVNAQTEHLFGYTAEELTGRSVEVLVPEPSRQVHRWHRERYAASEHVRPMITGPGIHGVHKDGRLVPVEVNLASVRLSTGDALVASVRDVSLGRQVETELRVSHDLMAGILSAATEQAIIATDLNGTIELFSDGAERLLGFRREEVIGEPAAMFDDGSPAEFATAWGLDATQSLQERIGTLVSSGVAATRPWAYRTRSGERRDVLLSVTVRTGPDGPAGLIIIATDQSQRLRRDAELAASEERFRLAFHHAPVGVALVSLAGAEPGRFLRVNTAMSDILGYGEDELLEASLPAIAHLEDLPLVVANVASLVDGDVSVDLVEHRCIHAEGHDVWVQSSFAVILDEAGRPDYAVCMLNDISARKQAESELTHNALHDTLTGLPNRALLTEHLHSALARASHQKTGVGVLYIDLDNFKDVNDSLGHAAGDELLMDVGHRLAGSMRDSDLAGRLGGDEFVVVCEDITSIDDVTAVADRVGRALAIQLPIAGQMVTVSASIGIAYAAHGDQRPEDLLRAADIAMYRAKGNGRSRYEFSDPSLQNRALRQLELEADLREALGVPTDAVSGPTVRRTRRPPRSRAAEQLFLDYQPCFDAATGSLVACEALLRWDHPSKGLLGPGQFLDVAEDRALMIPLGAWVLRQACTQAAHWAERFGPDAPEMWVNVSAAQIGRDRFVTRVADTLESTGLPARLLCLELTERQALSSAHSTLDDLHALPELGVRLSIDDFGTGYAGLDYLRRLPVSSLKVDASYVAAIGQDRTGTALAATVVNLGHALDLTVVAEGVETAEQRDAVVELGADVLQGYLLARPGPPAVVEELLLRQFASPQ